MNAFVERNRHKSSIYFSHFFIDPPNSSLSVPHLLVPQDMWDLARYNACGWKWKTCRLCDLELLIRYFFCANYSLRHTAARWVARVADDTIINFANLALLVTRLEGRYDPLTEFVFKGHCVSRDFGYGMIDYPQGGGGFVLSRFACKETVKHQVSLLKQAVYYEDVSIGKYLKEKGFPGIAMASGHLLGHKAYPIQWKRLMRLDAIPLCNLVLVKRRKECHARCGGYFEHVNQLVFVHTCPFLGFTRLLKFAHILFQAPSSIMWYNGCYGRPSFCQERNETTQAGLSFWSSPRIEWRPSLWY
jgi:hypothetical protein